jgi:hypothetical protein
VPPCNRIGLESVGSPRHLLRLHRCGVDRVVSPVHANGLHEHDFGAVGDDDDQTVIVPLDIEHDASVLQDSCRFERGLDVRQFSPARRAGSNVEARAFDGGRSPLIGRRSAIVARVPRVWPPRLARSCRARTWSCGRRGVGDRGRQVFEVVASPFRLLAAVRSTPLTPPAEVACDLESRHAGGIPLQGLPLVLLL